MRSHSDHPGLLAPYTPACSHCIGLCQLGRALTVSSLLSKNVDDTEHALKFFLWKKEIQSLQLHSVRSFLLTFVWGPLSCHTTSKVIHFQPINNAIMKSMENMAELEEIVAIKLFEMVLKESWTYPGCY